MEEKKSVKLSEKIDILKDQLDHAQADDSTASEDVLNLKWELCSAFREEELYWRQKSRATWLKEGNKNSKFFHVTTKQRRARNRITKLKGPNGAWVENEDGIERLATSYFQNIFTSTSPSDFDEALWYVTETVTPQINESLTKAP